MFLPGQQGGYASHLSDDWPVISELFAAVYELRQAQESPCHKCWTLVQTLSLVITIIECTTIVDMDLRQERLFRLSPRLLHALLSAELGDQSSINCGLKEPHRRRLSYCIAKEIQNHPIQP